MSTGIWIAGLLGATVAGVYIYKGFNPTVTVESNGSNCYPEARYDLKVTVDRLFSKRKIGFTVTKDKGGMGLASKPSIFGDVWVEPSQEQMQICKSADISKGQVSNVNYGLSIPRKVDIVYLNPFTKKKKILKTVDNSFTGE